jgi:hypothetical protein
VNDTYQSLHATEAPKAKRKWSRKQIIVASVLGGVILLPPAAYAAYQLFGYGQINSAAATTQNLTVDNTSAQLTKKLVPGATVGAKAVVTNPNDFPVTVTGVIVRKSTLAVTPNDTACQTSVHIVGSDTTWPDGGGDAYLQQIEENVVIQPGQSAWVTVPNGVRQDADATVLCGIKADFAVRAQTAS